MASGTVTSGGVTVNNSNPTLSWGNRSVVGTVNGEELSVQLPANPNTNINVVDNLASTSPTSALSANQGRILNEKIATPQTATAGGFYYYKVGRICYAVFSEGTLGSNINVNGTIANIPNGFRPIRVCPVCATAYISGRGDVPCRLHFNAGGSITLQGDNNLPAGSALKCSTCYVTYN